MFSLRLAFRPLPVLAGLLVTASIAAPAMASEPLPYRCTVAGDSSACEALAAMREEVFSDVVRPGPYARYLINLGRTQDQAIAEASRAGEAPERLQMMVQRMPLLDSLERYERLQGHRVRS